MKPSLRDPRDGWWSPEFRAWLRALDRGADPELLAELDRRAQLAAIALRADDYDDWGPGGAPPDEPGVRVREALAIARRPPGRP